VEQKSARFDALTRPQKALRVSAFLWTMYGSSERYADTRCAPIGRLGKERGGTYSDAEQREN
jgi:hypothetical protein